MSVKIDYNRFEISPKYGYMYENCLEFLPPYFDSWNHLSKQISTLIEEHRIRSQIDQLPLLSIDTLSNKSLLYLAHLQLVSLSSAYIWGEGLSHASQKLPKALAVPLWNVSKRLGMQPINCHAAFSLHNWSLKGGVEEYRLEDSKIYHGKFIREIDLDYFYLIPCQCEVDFGLAFPLIEGSLNAASRKDPKILTQNLVQLKFVIEKLIKSLQKIRSHVRPDVFFHKIRPFMTGYNGEQFPDGGIIFEGVSERPVRLVGASAAQSSILPTMEAFLGVIHAGEASKFMNDMKAYRVPEHEAFTEWLSEVSKIREFTQKIQFPDLTVAYNECLTAFANFRSEHFKIVTSYILNQVSRDDGSKVYGTGGSDAVSILKQLREDTNSAKLHVLEHGFDVEDECSEV